MVIILYDFPFGLASTLQSLNFRDRYHAEMTFGGGTAQLVNRCVQEKLPP